MQHVPGLVRPGEIRHGSTVVINMSPRRQSTSAITPEAAANADPVQVEASGSEVVVPEAGSKTGEIIEQEGDVDMSTSEQAPAETTPVDVRSELVESDTPVNMDETGSHLVGPSIQRRLGVRERLNAPYAGTEQVDPRLLIESVAEQARSLMHDSLPPLIAATEVGRELGRIASEQAVVAFMAGANRAHRRSLPEKLGGEQMADRTNHRINRRIMDEHERAPTRGVDAVIDRKREAREVEQRALKALADLTVHPFSLRDTTIVDGAAFVRAMEGDAEHPEIPPIAQRALRGVKTEGYKVNRDNGSKGETYCATLLVEDVYEDTFPRTHYLVGITPAHLPAPGQSPFVDLEVAAVPLGRVAESNMRTFMLSPDAIVNDTPIAGLTNYRTEGKVVVPLGRSHAFLSDPNAIGVRGARLRPWKTSNDEALAISNQAPMAPIRADSEIIEGEIAD